MEKILLFQCENALEIRQIAAAFQIKTVEVGTEFFRETLGILEKGEVKQPAEKFTGTPPEGSMMVFCNVTEKHFDRMLAELRKKQVEVSYKAVMTPTNKRWSVLRLYLELAREKSAYAEPAQLHFEKRKYF